MSELRIIVDHLKLDYNGIMDVKGLFKLISAFFKEREYHKKEDKVHEHNLPEGKFIEYEISPWKKLSQEEYTQYIIKIRALFQNLKKVEIIKDEKKVQLDQGRVLITFDGFIEQDALHRWDDRPLFIFFRTLYNKFLYRMYTERFEQRLVHEVQMLYDEIEKFLNVYRYQKTISKPPHY